MKITPTELRSNLYKILDTVLETHESIEISRKGKTLRLSLVESPTDKSHKLAHLKPHPDIINGNPEDIIDVDWTSSWDEENNI